MKLGISYVVFNGDELLGFVLRSVRPLVDFISVVVHPVSYDGLSRNPGLRERVDALGGLIDRIVEVESDTSLHYQENEVRSRNLGLDLSREAGCTHHISADVDEFYEAGPFLRLKEKAPDYDCMVVSQEFYFKEPTWLISPSQGLYESFIHPVDNRYDRHAKFPFMIDYTRRPQRSGNCLLVPKEEFFIHHMSYVRKDIRLKMKHSLNSMFYTLKKFCEEFEAYRLGDTLKLTPDFRKRTTVEVPNLFGININTPTLQ